MRHEPTKILPLRKTVLPSLFDRLLGQPFPFASPGFREQAPLNDCLRARKRRE